VLLSLVYRKVRPRDQPGNFDSILIHRFPGSRRSDTIPAWRPREFRAVTIPQTAAFADLQEHHDPCGVTELARPANMSATSICPDSAGAEAGDTCAASILDAGSLSCDLSRLAG